MAVNPVIRVLYGKWFDQLTGEFPVEDIREISGLRYWIEPGEAAVPYGNKTTITLANLDYKGDEKYPLQFFRDNERTQDEGAQSPGEMFVKIILQTGDEEDPVFKDLFYGVTGLPSYSKFHQEVQFEISDIPSYYIGDQRPMLGSFKLRAFLDKKIPAGSTSGTWSDDNNLAPAEDLDGVDTGHEKLVFFIDAAMDTLQGYDQGRVFGNPYAHHMNLIVDDNLAEFNTSRTRFAFVKIGKKTLFTQIRDRVIKGVIGGGFGPGLTFFTQYIEVWHSSNDDVLNEYGRYYQENGSPLETKAWLDIEVVDYDLGNSPSIMVKFDDLTAQLVPSTFTGWLHGVPQIQGLGPKTILRPGGEFNVVGKTLEIIERELLSVLYETTTGQSLIDSSLIGTDNHFAYFADAIMYGWLENNVIEMMVAIARQTNSMIFATEEGKIAFRERSLVQESAIAIPDRDLEAITGTNFENGFNTFDIRIPSTVYEIDNVRSEEQIDFIVSETGIVQRGSLRNTSLVLQNYRTGDLSVPNSVEQAEGGRKIFRRPIGHAAVTLEEREWILLPVEMARKYARSNTYPLPFERWGISYIKHQDIGIGKEIGPIMGRNWLIVELEYDTVSFRSVAVCRPSGNVSQIEPITGVEGVGNIILRGQVPKSEDGEGFITLEGMGTEGV